MNIQEVTLNFKNSEGKVTPVTFKVPHGISINPKGTIETVDLLSNLSPEFGDAYLINTGNSEGCLYIYTADNYPTDLCKGSWVNLGKIRGEKGRKGDNGLSAHELWKLTQPAGADTSLDTFLQSLKGETGQSFYDWWVDEQPDDADTSKEAFLIAMKGAKGDAGADMVAGDFLNGFVITNKNQQAIYRDGDTSQILLWGGILPKQVLAGSTPQSTGGIRKGAWVIVSDASLRSDIKANSGASLIGTKSGKTVQQKLDDLPSEINAVGISTELIKTHNHDKEAHPELSKFITDEANRAELAANSSIVNADVYSSVDAGLAATEDGQQFQVVEGDVIVRYERQNATTAVKLASYPSAKYVDAMNDRLEKEVTDGLDNLSALFAHPNFWFDDTLEILSRTEAMTDGSGISYYFNNVSATLKESTENPSVLLTSKAAASTGSISINVSQQVLSKNGISPGDKLTFGLKFLDSSGGLKTANDRIVIQQYDASGNEFADVRVTIPHPEARTPFFPFSEFKAVTIQQGCQRVRIYISISSSSNSIEIGNILLSKGEVTEYRPPYIRAVLSESSADVVTYNSVAYTSVNGSDSSGDGTYNNPFRTVDKAVSLLGGVGKVYISGGVRYDEQIDASKIVDIELIGGDDATHNRTEFYYGQKLSGITKTAGRNKTYQCSLDITSQPNFIWLDNVADVETKILPEHRHPLSRGREHRLWCTKIYATKAQQSTNAALNEIENARIPLCYYSKTEKVMYFSLPENTEVSTASIYVAMNNNLGLFNNKSNIWSPKGVIKLTNIHVRYGGIDTRGFVKAEQLNCSSIGAPANCFDVSWHDDLCLCEAAGAGSSDIVNGDGFNATQKADWTHSDCYAHDCNDDGFSSHQNCVEIGNKPVAEFNGGAGLCPSYGAQATYNKPITICNSVNPRAAIEKRGGVTCIQSPRNEDNGVITDCTVYGGLSIGDKNSYWDDGLDYGKQAQLTTYNCISINPVEYGFANLRAINCKHGGSGTAKKSGVVSVTLTNI